MKDYEMKDEIVNLVDDMKLVYRFSKFAMKKSPMSAREQILDMETGETLEDVLYNIFVIARHWIEAYKDGGRI